MRITDIEVHVLESPSDYGILQAENEAHGLKYSCVILVRTDEGIVGVSQLETQPHVIRAAVTAPGESSGLFSGLNSLAVGQDPLQVDALWERLFKGSYYYGRRGAVLQAISGIDIACWDILGKATGLPISTLLGGTRRQSVRAYASTLFRETPEDVHRAAVRYVERGFTAVKFGWGPFGMDTGLDVALVQAAREGIGREHVLMVDAGWRKRRTAKEAVALIRSIEPFSPYWVEEPCFPEDYGTYRQVRDAVETRIAAGEAESTTWDFRRLAESVDVLQPDLSRCGGLTIGRRIAYLAEDLNVAVCPHAWGSDILTAATLHFTASLASETFLEFNTSADSLSRELVEKPFQVVNGRVQVPDGPGLGIDVDLDRIEALRAL